jgi:pimeloyl-ACP methyl ester carboxylesterase
MTPEPDMVILSPYGADLWSDVLDQLPQLGRVIAPDLGRGGDLSRMASEILRDAPRVFHLMGLCMGGYLAFEIMRQAPARVSALALLNTSAAPDSEQMAAARARRITSLEMRLRDQAEPDDAYIENAVRWLISPASQNRPRVADRVRTILKDVSLKSSLAQQRAMMNRPDSRGALGRLRIPTLVVGGQHDRICAPSHSREIAASISGSDIVVIEQCGHLAPVEAPARVAQAVGRWIVRSRGVH